MIEKNARVVLERGARPMGTVLSAGNDETAYVRLDSGLSANFPIVDLSLVEDKDLRPDGLEAK